MTESNPDALRVGALPSAAESTPISQIMTRKVISVAPDTDVSVLTRLLLHEQISGAPVIDENGRPLGVVSKTDALNALSEGRSHSTARDLMTPLTLAMPEHASVARAAALMSYERVHRVVVVGPGGEVIGLVSSIDILRWLARHDGFVIS